MMKTTSIIICIVLVALALFFLLCLKGYEYITYTLLFITALILISNLCPPTIKKIVYILTCIGLIYFFAVEILVISNSRTEKNDERDYVIVLGAAVHGDIPSLSLTHRLEGTLDYLERYPNSKAVVSGGQGNGENISEGDCMKSWLIEKGIDESRIIAETKATTTNENLIFSSKLIDEENGDSVNVAILSSPYHLYRAKSMARNLGMNPCGVACVYGYPIYSLGMFIREAFGVTHLWVFGD